MSVRSRDVLRQGRVTTESAFTRTVPFDYVVTLPFGQSGETTQSLVNISTVGPFVVTGIGYSLLTNEREAPTRFGSIEPGAVEALINSAIPQLATPAQPIIEIGATAKRGRKRSKKSTATTAGFRLFGAPGARLQLNINGQPLKAGLVQLDSNGRAQLDLSDLPALTTLVITDIANGRSSPTVTLLSAGQTGATIQVTPQFGPLQPQTGSSMFDVVATPGVELEATVRVADGSTVRLTQSKTVPNADDSDAGVEAGLVRFDFSELKLRRQRTLVSGDLLMVRDTSSNLSTTFQVAANPLDISLRALPSFALRRGFRLHKSILEKYLDNEILPPPEEADAPFVPCGSEARELNFLYSIIDNGTGRALQNEPIHNIAGLGIADGDRPFRTFPKPFVLDPRSVLLFQVQALSGGPGTLYFVLQGYKVVGGTRKRLPGSE